MVKKLIALLLAVLMLFSLAACNNKDDKDGKDSTKSASADGEEPTLSDEENTVHYLLINYAPTMEDDFFLEVRIADGEVIAELNGEEHKVGTIDADKLFDIEEKMIDAGIMDLIGTDTYDDGEETAAVYMEYTDGDQLMINYNGSIPKEFVTAYTAMEKYFAKLLKNAPDYVPEPKVDENVDEAQLALLKDIIAKSSLEDLDNYKIYDIAKDVAAATLGLDNADLLITASGFDSKMLNVPYSLVVIKASSTENIEALRADLADSLRWENWVHVPVDNALIAQKDDMVLCLMAAGDNYKNTAKAIADCGWQNIAEYKK